MVVVPLLWPSVAFAAISERDVLFLTRALSFMETPKTDMLRLVVVYDPDDADSKQEADQFAAVIGDKGLKVARIQIDLSLLSIDDVEKLDGADVLVITSGLKQYQSSLAKLSEQKGAFTISGDLSCVEVGDCVLGLQSQPSVRILLNSEAASRAGVAFEPAFRMMVTEL
ncbi:MAG: hypothetical protein CMM50_14410 [Rhodospirillaceae bacterium]|nr:hypothetical protein [Rhodospirillaceae bacterium]